MTAEDWASLGLLGNEIALQWYSTTHPDRPIATPPQYASINVPGVKASFNTNLLIIGAVVVVAVLLLK